MGHLLRSFAIVAALFSAASPLAAFDGPPPPGGNAKGAAAAKKEDTAASKAQKMLDTGVAAYEAGKTAQAVRAFDNVINGGGLSSQQLARALYYRGLSYRKRGEQAQAIADLTSAAWMKDGLSAPEQQEAMAVRSAAYRDAGITDVPQAATAMPAPSIGFDGWQTGTNGSSAAPPAASAPVTAPQQTATYAPARPPPPQPQSTSSSGGVGGFFNSITNMFGGGSSSSSSSNSSQQVTTSAIQPPPPAAGGWSQATQVATTPPPPAQPQGFTTQTQVTAAAPPPAQPQASAPLSGKYHVQVAAVRSRDEANTLSMRLLSEHGGELGPRRPEIDETVIGSMGTFYRVTVGPFVSEKESQQLCGSLRTGGFDCLVISQ